MASLGRALMPRTAQALGEGRPWYSPRVGLASIADQASLPGRAQAPTIAQGLGRRVTSGAIGASLRKYLSDDRPQGDTPYTRNR